MSYGDNVSFKRFCDLCNRISKADRERKSDILSEFIRKWRESTTEVKGNECETLDRERGAYGMKENTLAKIYIRILCLPKNGNDATKLLEYRIPKSGGNQSCDFAEVVYWILRSRCSKGEELSVAEVNRHLDEMAKNHALNNPRGVDSELITLLRGTSAEEQKWLIRIILKDMKLGLGHNKIMYCYHPDASDLYDSCNDLKKICDVLVDPQVRLHEIGIEVFSPFRPMLAEECDCSKVENYLKRSAFFFVETKLDGERFQIHMNRNEFRYFSRNGYDYTSNFGKTPKDGLLTPYLFKQIRSDVQTLILDGEMMCWDTPNKRYVSKGMNTEVKNLKDVSKMKPCFCVFDILHLDGEILTNQPLSYRLALVEEIVTPAEGVVSFVDRKKISTKEEVWDALNMAIENREEGIVMKDFLSVYKPNLRKNGGWYKLKPEYTDGLMDHLDLLIVGGYYGSGRREGKISHFLLGVVADADSETPKKLYSVARVGSGYTMNELSELQMKLEPYWKKVIPGQIPKEIEWTREKPDLWIEPSKSFILQVKASEIMPSDFFRTGYTLRFPRVEKVRYDKSWMDCLTLKEFEEKRKAASGKLVKGNFESSDTDESITPKKSPRMTVTVPAQFRPASLSEVEKRSQLLAGREICVFSGFGGYKKNDVERKVAEHGGSLVQNPGPKTYCVLAEEISNVRIANLIKSGSHDVIRASWFISQLDDGKIDSVPLLTPEVLLGAAKKTEERLCELYDDFGDSYTCESDAKSLMYPFRVAAEKIEETQLTEMDLWNLDEGLFSGPNPYSLFRYCVAHFDRSIVPGERNSSVLEELELTEIDYKFHGGASVQEVSESTTHVIVSTKDLSRVNMFQRMNRLRKRKVHIVTDDWVKYSLRSGALQNEGEFYPVMT